MTVKLHQNLNAVVFVYENVKEPFLTATTYFGGAENYTNNPDWKHTATIDPAGWIEYLLNNPEEREWIISKLCCNKNQQPKNDH